jgi:hypothetical protein
LHELQQIFAPAGFRIGTAHIESAKRMRADQSASTFAIQIKVPTWNSRRACARRSSDAEYTAPVKPNSVSFAISSAMVVILGFDHGKHRSKDLFLFDRVAGFYVVDDRWVR